MKNTLQVIATVSKVPEFTPQAVKSLMKKLEMNERAFALIMNVTPVTVRFWTTGAAKPCGTSKRLMQLFESCPELIGKVMQRQDEKT